MSNDPQPFGLDTEQVVFSEPSEFTIEEATQLHNATPPRRPAPANDRSPPKRKGTSCSVDFFDPAGVRRLHRALTLPTGIIEMPDPAESITSDQTLEITDPFDLEKTLKTVVQRKDAAHIQSRELGVMFENLRVTGLGSSAAYFSTVGSVLNPITIYEKLRTLRNPPLRNIIEGFEGVVRPGEMLRMSNHFSDTSSSLNTTFLKILANHRSGYHSVQGNVHYDSFTPEQVYNQYRGDVQYCAEDDYHFPTMSVKQTLHFAGMTRVPHARFEESKGIYVNTMTEVLSTIFGLNHVQDTPVGDAAIRGVSGGEKKRVSIAEALATRSRIHCWDNSTRGLDSSTALEFGRALRIATDIDHQTTIVSIYQAGETLYELFDKVCLLYEGRMVYYGPADKARQYFIDMGYQPANRQTTPDFLVAVTHPTGRIPRQDFVGPVPRTATEFAEYFLKSDVSKENRRDMELYKEAFVDNQEKRQAYGQSVSAEHARSTRKKSPYTISTFMQIRSLMRRRMQILWGDKSSTLFLLFSFIFEGVIFGTAFLKLPETTSAYFSRGGVLFFALLFSALSSLAEIPNLFQQRPIVDRHAKAAMYHPFGEALAMTIVYIPIAFTTAMTFAILIYFIAGLQSSAAQFFTFYLFLFLMSLTMKAWFRGVAAAFKAEASAQAVGGISLLVMIMYTGYTIPKPSMIGALRWISYINPLRYAFESVVANEFHTISGICSNLIPRGPGYEGVSLSNQVCTMVGAVQGQSTVDGNRFIQLSYGYTYSNVWRNFGIVCAFATGFIFILLIFTEINTSISGNSSMVLFKRGAKHAPLKKSDSADEEKGMVGSEPLSEQDKEVSENAFDTAPVTKDVFSWQHLKYSVPVSGGYRVLLDDVSGYVVPGKLTALMGESGAGKTTLLNVLAQRVDTGVVEGEQFINGQLPPLDFQSQSGYCQQMDTHTPTDTVREALRFSASLRQPSCVPKAEKYAYVEECLKMCGLEKYANATVGSLNVEFRKRTTIAIELAAKVPQTAPLLDEPTSGLDSQSSWAIMKFLRTLVDNGQAILCTIHQPSAELFQLFDRLLLLRRGGQTVYFGDLGYNTTTLIRYFEKNGSRLCEPDENPAEFMLDVIGAGATASANTNWHKIWKDSHEFVEVQKESEMIHGEGQNHPPVTQTLHTEFATSWLHQTGELLARNSRAFWRDPTYISAKLALDIFAGLFIGFTFFKARNSQQGTQNQLFAVYMSTILAAPLSNQIQVPFLNARKIYEIRERPSQMYSWTALVTSQYLSELPWDILGSSLYFLCWYWTVGFDTSRAGYTYLMLGVMFPAYYTSLAMCVAALAPSTEIAAPLFSVLFLFVIAFNGVLQPYHELHWWKWMYHLSPFTYLVEGVLGQAVGGKLIKCSPVELVTLDPPSGETCQSYLQTYIHNAGGYVANPMATSGCEFCTFATTDQFLAANFNIYYSHHWRNFGILAAYIIFTITGIYFFTYLRLIGKRTIGTAHFIMRKGSRDQTDRSKGPASSH